ncbi:hypothetical protein [Mycobacterium sp. SA01]|uniref:hypothetical protein n=1 Tax=Mycobacterium sp. SA01 TaxID=3238820 RepID=UPI00351AEFED
MDNREVLRARYFAQFPRNPSLDHRYWVNEARDAWADGSKRVTALCGAPMILQRDPNGPAADQTPDDELVEPDDMSDTEYEDPETGLWWVDMACVDCIAVANGVRLERQRKALMRELIDAATRVKDLDPVRVAELRERLAKLEQR